MSDLDERDVKNTFEEAKTAFDLAFDCLRQFKKEQMIRSGVSPDNLKTYAKVMSEIERRAYISFLARYEHCEDIF